jgi:hypothetical protein
MHRTLIGTMMALTLAAVVHSDTALTGKWLGETPNGAEIALDLTATETALTGTLTRKATLTFRKTLSRSRRRSTTRRKGSRGN